MILGSDPVETGSGFAVSAGSIALATASGKRAFISRRKPSSVSTPAAILAIAANSARPGLLAVSNEERLGAVRKSQDSDPGHKSSKSARLANQQRKKRNAFEY